MPVNGTCGLTDERAKTHALTHESSFNRIAFTRLSFRCSAERRGSTCELASIYVHSRWIFSTFCSFSIFSQLHVAAQSLVETFTNVFTFLLDIVLWWLRCCWHISSVNFKFFFFFYQTLPKGCCTNKHQMRHIADRFSWLITSVKSCRGTIPRGYWMTA